MDRQKIAAALALPAVAIAGEVALVGAQALAHLYLVERGPTTGLHEIFDRMPSFLDDGAAQSDVHIWSPCRRDAAEASAAHSDWAGEHCPIYVRRIGE